MVQKKQSLQVKKVSPYPFDGQLELDGNKLPLQVDKITHKGFLAHVGPALIKAGREGKVTLQLPVHSTWVIASVKVVKTYDKMAPKEVASAKNKFKSAAPVATNPAPNAATKVETPLSKLKIERIVEFFFLNLSEDHKANINKFTSAIGQE